MMMDPSARYRDIYDLSTRPPRRIGWRDTNGAQAVDYGGGRYAFCDEWNAMSPEERRAYPSRFEQQARTRPSNPHEPSRVRRRPAELAKICLGPPSGRRRRTGESADGPQCGL
jgi:hypothetical protein